MDPECNVQQLRFWRAQTLSHPHSTPLLYDTIFNITHGQNASIYHLFGWTPVLLLDGAILIRLPRAIWTATFTRSSACRISI